MSASKPLAITAVAARTAAGASAEQTATSIRANVIRLAEDPIYTTIPADPDAERAPVRAARVPGVDPALDGAARLSALAEPMLTDLLDRAEQVRRDPRRAALLLALPARDAATERWELDRFAVELAQKLGVPFAVVEVSRAGGAGALSLLAEASALITRGAVDRCVVAGVDTFLTPDRLAHYDEAERLLSPKNPDGFFPGEAAAALLVEGDRRGDSAGIRLAGVGAGSEPEAVRSDKPSTGRGLTDAIRGALGDGSARWVVTHMNGESYRGYEWGLVRTRLGDRLQSLAATTYPLRNTGEIGAATGAVQIAFATVAFHRGAAPAGEALLVAGSDGAERAAALLKRP